LRKVNLVYIAIFLLSGALAFFGRIFQDEILLSKNTRSIASVKCPYGHNAYECIRPKWASNCLVTGERAIASQRCCSGYSKNFICVGSLDSLSENNQYCTEDNQCRSGSCKNSRCQATLNSLGNFGEGCFNNNECYSEYCSRGKCAGYGNFKAPYLAYCQTNSQCQSGICNNETCADEYGNAIYCPNTLNENYCPSNQRPNNWYCSTNENCSSGQCFNNRCVGSPYNIGKTGDICYTNFNCESGSCFLNTCQ
jgi:hypothetical protein